MSFQTPRKRSISLGQDVSVQVPFGKGQLLMPAYAGNEKKAPRSLTSALFSTTEFGGGTRLTRAFDLGIWSPFVKGAGSSAQYPVPM